MKNNNSPECRMTAQCLGGRIRVLNRVITGIYDDALRPYKVRISQTSILNAVAAMGPVRAADICRLLRMDKSTLSRDLDRLVQRKLIRVTPVEGRAQELSITPAGQALLAKMVPAWEAVQERIHELFGPEFAKVIFQAIERLKESETSV